MLEERNPDLNEEEDIIMEKLERRTGGMLLRMVRIRFIFMN